MQKDPSVTLGAMQFVAAITRDQQAFFNFAIWGNRDLARSCEFGEQIGGY